MEKSKKFRHDLDSWCNCCIYNNRTDREFPCNVCKHNELADKNNDRYSVHYEGINP